MFINFLKRFEKIVVTEPQAVLDLPWVENQAVVLWAPRQGGRIISWIKTMS